LVILWINGAFGAGKTTLAETLHGRLPDALSFDPEYVGSMVRSWVPGEVTDFQDIPLWRRLTAECVIGMYHDYRQPLIVPMTLVNTDYRKEIFDRISDAGMTLLHVFLEVPADELQRRIDDQVLVPDDPERDAQARAFRSRNIARCVAARSVLSSDTLVLPGALKTPNELADSVLEAFTARRAWRTAPTRVSGRGG
jgi:AAA domain